MKNIAIIVAGGSGSRMGANLPKQFLLINNKPVLMHTIEKFYNFDNKIRLVIVLPKNQIDYWIELIEKYDFAISHTIVEGGESRFFSVKNGLEKVTDQELVLIHDGVRPLVSDRTIERCCEEALKNSTAIPAMPVNESLRKIKNDENKAVDRARYVNIQTPQVFRRDVILDAYNVEFKPWFTDDASVVEANGQSISLVEGNRENIKLTHPGDLKIAEALIK